MGKGRQGGVYKSTDGGERWVAKNTGLSQTMGAVEAMTSNYPVLVIDNHHPQTLYVGNNSWTPDPGIYTTTDGGEHWSWIRRDEPPNKNVDPGWITEQDVAVKALAIDPLQPNRLYFGTSTHVFTTNNGGVSWNQAYSEPMADGYWQGNGLETTCIQDVAVDPTDSQRIYAGYILNFFALAWELTLRTDTGKPFKEILWKICIVLNLIMNSSKSMGCELRESAVSMICECFDSGEILPGKE